MTVTKKRLVWMGLVIATGVVTLGASVAFAEGNEGKEGKREGCSKSKSAEARFAKADSNGDGFLTATEVGEKKWNRIKVADTNADSKVSLAEMKQAKLDGKIGHKSKKKKERKEKKAA